jgi:hypothetical protein
MPNIRELIKAQYPIIAEMPFCSALRNGRFGRTEILRSEIVELYRALNTRQTIQDIYKEKLHQALGSGMVTRADVNLMEEVIDDEGETDEHIDHLDMRFKLFVGTPVSRAVDIRDNDDLEQINQDWMQICREADLLTTMALTAAIEDWYAPLSAFFEEEYRKRGFTDDELELFIVHKAADLDHSEAQFNILERNANLIDVENMVKMVQRTFGTSKAYDAMKLKLAETECSLNDLIVQNDTRKRASA